MTIPLTAVALPQPMDPRDVLDHVVVITKAGVDEDAYPILQATENVDSFEVALTAEAVAVGLQIQNDDTYPAPTISYSDGSIGVADSLLMTVWLAIDPAMRGSPIFNESGVTLAIELTVTTDSTPPRVKQRTFTVQVQQL